MRALQVWPAFLAVGACREPKLDEEARGDDTACVPGEEVPYDGVDQDCDGADLDDVDGDGYGQADDCDDADATAYPEAKETPYDGVDQDCDGADLDDLDGDGYGQADDCDDTDPVVNPAVGETCGDGVDNDCDGGAEECRFAGERSLSDADVKLWGEDAWDLAGYHVASAGDPDADGLVDLLVTGPDESTAGTGAGAVWLVRGPVAVSGSLAGADAKLLGEFEGDSAGDWAAGPGDLDGDGFDDIVVGAIWSDAGGVDAGAAYVVLGPVTGTMSLSWADSRFEGEAAGDWAGRPAAGAGDLDGDGLPDLVIGAEFVDSSGEDAGAAYVVRGPATAGGSLSVADARLLGENAEDQAGYAAAGAGDLDGDGLDDLLVGAPSSSQGTGQGIAYVVHGPVTGTESLADADARLLGESLHQWTAYRVAGAGDTDGDGYLDVMVGAPSWSEGYDFQPGRTYVVRGPVSGLLGLDAADARLTGEEDWDLAGCALAGAGDLVRDGNMDFIVGARMVDEESDDAGAAYLWYGPVSGDHPMSDADARFLGEASPDYAGVSVSAGDFDGDTFIDLVVGAYAHTPETGTEAGAAYLIRGTGL